MIEGLKPQITDGLHKIEVMRQKELILKQQESEMETNKSFAYSVEVTEPGEINLRGTSRHTTTCFLCNYTLATKTLPLQMTAPSVVTGL